MTWARACVVRRLNVFECVRMMTRMFVPCMLVCSAVDALVVAAGFRCNIQVHFVAATFARRAKKSIVLHLYHVLACAVKFLFLFTVMQVASKRLSYLII